MNFLSDSFGRERARWNLWTPVFIGAGISIYFSLSHEPSIWTGVVPAIGCGVATFYTRGYPKCWMPFAALFLLFLGLTVARWQTISVSHVVLEKRFGPTLVTGRVVGVDIYPKGGRLLIEKVRAAGLRADLTPDRARLRIHGDASRYLPGDWVRLRAVLLPPPAPSAPGAFDFQRRLYFQMIGATGFVMGPVKTFSRTAGPANFGVMIATWRQNISERIRAVYGGEAGAVSAALMTGVRHAIPEAVLEAFRKTGLAHLLAISGLHVGLIAGLILALLRGSLALVPPLALRYPIKKITAAGAICGAFAYAVIAGATIPTQRSFIMIGLVLLAVILDRQGISMRLVAWAALIILIMSPHALLGASFQLSFAAVIALIAVYEWWAARRYHGSERRGGMWPRIILYIGGVAVTSLVASLATAPFALFHFNRIAVAGILANLIAVPITGFWIMPFAVLAFLLMPFGWDFIALMPMGWGVEAVITVAKTVAAWDYAVISLPAMPTSALIGLSLGGLWLCLWRHRWRFVGVLPLALALLTVFTQKTPDIAIDHEGRLFALKDDQGVLRLSSAKIASFTGQTWLRRAGQSIGPTQTFQNATTPPGGLRCDGLGCIYSKDAQVIALVTSEQALADDCHKAQIVVSAVPVFWHCPSAHTVIDRFDLWRQGAHAIWLKPGGATVVTVNGSRGDRPWVLKPNVRPKVPIKP